MILILGPRVQFFFFFFFSFSSFYRHCHFRVGLCSLTNDRWEILSYLVAKSSLNVTRHLYLNEGELTILTTDHSLSFYYYDTLLFFFCLYMCVHERQYALIHDEHVINCKFSIITESGVEVYPELGCPKKRTWIVC